MTTIKKILEEDIRKSVEEFHRLNKSLKWVAEEETEPIAVFIYNILSASHSHLIEEIIKMCEGMKKIRHLGDTDSPSEDSEWSGYNTALSDIITNLSTLIEGK